MAIIGREGNSLAIDEHHELLLDNKLAEPAKLIESRTTIAPKNRRAGIGTGDEPTTAIAAMVNAIELVPAIELSLPIAASYLGFVADDDKPRSLGSIQTGFFLFPTPTTIDAIALTTHANTSTIMLLSNI